MTAGPFSTWTLRTSTDPLKLVPGSPSGLRADADDLAARGRAIVEVQNEIASRTEMPSWRGQAYDGWITRRDDLSAAHAAVAEVLSSAAWALRAHADVLAWAQVRAGVAVRLWAQGEAQAAAGSTALVPSRSGFGMALRDAGATARDDAVAALEGARAEVTASGNALAQVLDALSAGLPDGRFHAADFFAGIGSWFTGIAATLWQLSSTRFVLDLGGWTTSVGEHADGIAGTWSLLTEDPLDAPGVLVDLETFKDSPGRWWGGLAPDIALSVAGGVGLGTKTASLLGAGRWSRLGTASEALSASARVEAAASVSDVGGATTRLGAALARVEDRWPGHSVLHETSGRTGAWNTALHRPLPDTVYIVDDAKQLYATDNLGRVRSVEAEWEPTPRPDAALRRNEYQQSVSGREWRQPGDVGGHLAAAGGGGPGEGVNLVAMDRAANGTGGAYGRMEADIRSLAVQHPESTIKLEVELQYPGQSTRPDYVSASYYRDGEFVDSVEFEQ